MPHAVLVVTCLTAVLASEVRAQQVAPKPPVGSVLDQLKSQRPAAATTAPSSESISQGRNWVGELLKEVVGRQQMIVPQDLGGVLSPSPSSPAEELLRDPDVKAKVRAAYLAELDDRADAYALRRNVVRVRNLMDVLIFVIVHAFLALGIWAAFHEFRRANRLRGNSPTATDDRTVIELGMEKVAIKTSLHGLLILGVCFAFYFLYLKFVHPIQVIGEEAVATKVDLKGRE